MVDRLRFVRTALNSVVPCIYAAGLNFKSHAAEVKLPLPMHPVWTMKAPSSILPCACVTAPSQAPSIIRIPEFLSRGPPEVDYEGELAVVVGPNPLRNMSAQEVASSSTALLGVTCALDISARRWQGKKGGGQWCFAKSLDTFCPIMTTVVNFTDVPLCTAIREMEIATTVNGELRQRESLSNMVFPVEELVSFLSRGMTLHPGTVILTGTPAGVGFKQKKRRGDGATEGKGKGEEEEDAPLYLADGDEIRCSVTFAGEIFCRVKEEQCK